MLFVRGGYFRDEVRGGIHVQYRNWAGYNTCIIYLNMVFVASCDDRKLPKKAYQKQKNVIWSKDTGTLLSVKDGKLSATLP